MLRRIAPLLVATACTGGGPADAPDAQPAPPDAAPGEWTTLVSTEWTLPPGSEDWLCVKRTISSDVYVVAIRPIAPPGTHHTLLGIVGGTEPGACTGDVQSFVYASGVGTGELRMPAGVGLRLPAGESLELELHLFNVGDEPLSGTSGIQVVTAPASDVPDEAEIFFPGPLVLDIPPGTAVQRGTCTVDRTQTLFAIFPHMHQLGSYLRSTALVGGETITLSDGPYSFDDQAFVPIEPVVLAPGDSITTECTYENTTGQAVAWGNSSTEEMCFSILYRYPKIPGAGPFCVQ